MRRSLLGIAFVVVLTLSIVSQAVAYSIAKEMALGKEVAAEVAKEMPPSKNEKWQKDIQNMGQRFLPYLKRKEISYTFQVVEAKDTLNAFAVPGGYVYFTERMWQILTPDERAAVMAHEITHCDQRHAIDSMIKAQQRMLWTLPLIVLGPGWFNAVGMGNTIVSQRYSRKNEREADELGIQLLKNAGFNPAGSVTSMKKLLHIESSVNRYEVSEIFASHPDTLKRVEYLTDMAEKLGAKPEELELRAVDDPSRIGNVTDVLNGINGVHAKAFKPLAYGDKVAIKKQLWNDETQSLAPRLIAYATVLTPGILPTLLVEPAPGFYAVDVMEGDGIYPVNTPVVVGDTSKEVKF